MAFKQVRTILAPETQTADAGTKVVKLPLSNFLHTLGVLIEAQLGEGPTAPYSIYDHTTKIEVIANGSEVIFSLTPKEIHDWHRALWDFEPIHVSSDKAGATVYSYFYIPFGRLFWDVNNYLPCAKFADLELRISYAPTIDADGFASGTTKIAVYGYMTIGGEPGPFSGILRRTTVYDYTTPTSGDTVIDLPRRLPINGIMVYAEMTGATLEEIISNTKLSLNGDQTVPLNLPTSVIKALQTRNHPPVNSVVIDLAEFENAGPLDPKKYDMVQLVLTNATAGADAKVSLEEVLAA
jgi:hypothetical protein